MILAALYNLALLLSDWRSLRRLWLDPRSGNAVRAALELAVFGVTIAVLLGLGSTFRTMGLLAWGIFVHGPTMLLLGALALRRTSSATAWAGVAGALVIFGVGVYAFGIEPSRLQVTKHELASTKLDRPVRIVLISDLQTDRIGSYERRALEETMALEPDLILLSGDYLQIRDPERRREVREQLRWSSGRVRSSTSSTASRRARARA